VDVQVVAFPQDGIEREPGTEALLGEAMALGADIVGGIPWSEADEAAMQRHCDVVLEIAASHDAPISMLVDDVGNPSLRTLEMMADRVIDTGWHGRALAHHARAMALYPEGQYNGLVALLLDAQMAVVADPHTGPLHARYRDLARAGVTVCLGQDDISDAYYAFGRNNMLEVGFLAAHLLWMMDTEGLESIYDGITTAAAQAMGLDDFGVVVGSAANLVVLGATSVTEALRHHDAPLAVFNAGTAVDLGAMLDIAELPN
jgi:cytosine deaminase